VIVEANRRDIDSFVDGLKFGRFHLQVLVLGVLIMLVDGYEVGVLGLVLPLLSKDYGVARASLSWVLSAQQVGMVLGAYFIAPLADRIGRRPLVLFSLTAVGLSCFVTILTTSLTALALSRLITGIFASTLIANLVAWTSEVAPARHRATMVTIVLTGSTAGALLGSAVQAFVLEPYGWRGAFWVGATFPLVLALAAYFFFSESPRFIASRDLSDPRLAAFARSVEPGSAPVVFTATTRVGDARRTGAITELFRGGLAGTTVLLWLCFALDYIFITSWFWKTTIFHDIVGLDWRRVAVLTGMEVIFGGVGMLTIGLLVNRWGFRAVLPSYFLVAAVAMAAMGLTAPAWPMYVALAIQATAQNAGHAGLTLVAASLYPTRNRATGVGWAYGAGRIASVAGPPFGAIPLQYGWNAPAYFSLLALPLVLTAIAVLLLLTKHRISIRSVGHQPDAART
jgi:AAHS family 4-hydroxybenzoate transporter-like MFS transporter